MEGIVAYGADALPHVREHLLVSTRIAWPIKLIKALGDEKDVVEILKSALDFSDVAFDQAKVDKNYDILCHLRDYQLPGFAPTLTHFLKDLDERVRFACTEVLLEQTDDPEVPALLEHFIGDESPDNIRMRQMTIQAFLTRKWVLKHPERFANGHVVGGLFVGPDHRLLMKQ
jgi:HEAT repeat protein